MTSSAALLLTDVNTVLDELEARFPGVHPEARRAQLTELVKVVCQRHGEPYPDSAVAEVIEAVMTRNVHPIAVTPVAPPARPAWSNRAQRTWRRWITETKTWWGLQSARRQRGLRTTGICLGLGAALTFFPWSAVIRAPFLLALREPSLYVLLFWAAMVGLFLGWRKAQRECDSDRAFWYFLAGGLLAVIGAGGGFIAYGAGHSLNDVQRFQKSEAPAVVAALDKSMGDLAGGASFAQIMGEVHKNLQTDTRVDMRNLDLTEDDDVQAMELHYSFDQDECAALRAHPNRYFTVAEVNGHPVNPDSFTCPAPWDNQVTVRSNVAWASHSTEDAPLPAGALSEGMQAALHSEALGPPPIPAQATLPPLPSNIAHPGQPLPSLPAPPVEGQPLQALPFAPGQTPPLPPVSPRPG